MMQEHLNRKFERWLKEPANNSVLDGLIKSVHLTMKKKGLFLQEMHPEETDEKRFREELKQECLVFLLKDKSMLSDLIGRNALGLVIKKLYNRFVDLSRNGKDIQRDTWRLLRRNILRYLGESDRFFKNRGNPGENYFSRTPDARQAAIAAEDLKGIAYPPDLPLFLIGSKTKPGLNTKENILKAAQYFWASAAMCAYLTDISLPVNEFINWIGQHIDLQARVLSGESSDGDDDKPGILKTSSASNAFNDSKKRTLTIWAQKCFNYLDDKEKHLFFYFICKKLKHDAVSKLMGKKSYMSYQRDKMIHRLRSFLGPLDWVAPDKGQEIMDTADLDFFRFQLCTDLDTWHTRKEKA